MSTKHKNETEADKAHRKLIHTFPLTPMSIVVEGALQLMTDDTKNSKCHLFKESKILRAFDLLAETVLCLPEGNFPMGRPALPGTTFAAYVYIDV